MTAPRDDISTAFYARKVNRAVLNVSRLIMELNQEPEIWREVRPMVISDSFEILKVELDKIMEAQ